MARATFTLKGLEDYYEALTKAGVDINEVAREALAEVGPILQNEMKARVPVGNTGNLSEHIKIFTPSREGDYNHVRVGIIHDIRYTDEKTAIYANVVEYGSPTKNIPARPFIRPAIDAKRREVLRIIRARLKAAGMVD